jgi:hypothetical protein
VIGNGSCSVVVIIIGVVIIIIGVVIIIIIVVVLVFCGDTGKGKWMCRTSLRGDDIHRRASGEGGGEGRGRGRPLVARSPPITPFVLYFISSSRE